MHSILHCPHPDLADIRRTALEQLQCTADDLLRSATISAEPLLTSLIHFVVNRSQHFQYMHIDRIWLGTWNLELLEECLSYHRSPAHCIPQHIPLSLIHRFDRIAAQLQSILLRHFLLLHATAHKRAPPTATPTAAAIAPISQHSPQPLSSQRRLTDLWQLPPPYIADRPAPCAIPRSQQLPITRFLQPSLSASELPQSSAAAPITPPPHQQQ